MHWFLNTFFLILAPFWNLTWNQLGFFFFQNWAGGWEVFGFMLRSLFFYPLCPLLVPFCIDVGPVLPPFWYHFQHFVGDVGCILHWIFSLGAGWSGWVIRSERKLFNLLYHVMSYTFILCGMTCFLIQKYRLIQDKYISMYIYIYI